MVFLRKWREMWKWKDRGSLDGNQENRHMYMHGCVPEIITTRLTSYAFSSSVRIPVALWTVAHQAPLSMGFPRQCTGVVCHALLQGIFPTQGSNLCLLHWQVDFLPLARLTEFRLQWVNIQKDLAQNLVYNISVICWPWSWPLRWVCVF